MILVSTHEKLVKKGATIYRVDFPRFEYMGVVIEAHHQHFATKQQAEVLVESMGACCSGKITAVPASSFNPWTDS